MYAKDNVLVLTAGDSWPKIENEGWVLTQAISVTHDTKMPTHTSYKLNLDLAQS